MSKDRTITSTGTSTRKDAPRHGFPYEKGDGETASYLKGAKKQKRVTPTGTPEGPPIAPKPEPTPEQPTPWKGYMPGSLEALAAARAYKPPEAIIKEAPAPKPAPKPTPIKERPPVTPTGTPGGPPMAPAPVKVKHPAYLKKRPKARVTKPKEPAPIIGEPFKGKAAEDIQKGIDKIFEAQQAQLKRIGRDIIQVPVRPIKPTTGVIPQLVPAQEAFDRWREKYTRPVGKALDAAIEFLTPISKETHRDMNQLSDDVRAFDRKWRQLLAEEKTLGALDPSYQAESERLESRKKALETRIAQLEPFIQEIDKHNREVKKHTEKWGQYKDIGIPPDLWVDYQEEVDKLAKQDAKFGSGMKVSSDMIKETDEFNQAVERFNRRWARLSELGMTDQERKQYEKEASQLKDKSESLGSRIKKDKQLFTKSGFPAEDITKASIRRHTAIMEMLVPGVYTARRWEIMTAPAEREMSVATDLAAILLIYGAGKALGGAGRALDRSLRQTRRLATKAGQADREFHSLMKAVRFTKQDKPIYRKVVAQNIQEATLKSKKADRAFLNRFSRMREVDPRSLKEFEKLSGYKGLNRATQDVNWLQNRLGKQWNRLDKVHFDPNAKTLQEIYRMPKPQQLRHLNQVRANNQHLKLLAEIRRTQVALDRAIAKVGQKFQPRVKEAAPPDQFRGYQLEFKPEKVYKLDTSSKSAEYIGDYLEPKAPGAKPKVKVAVAERPKVKLIEETVYKVKKKAVFEKPSPAREDLRLTLQKIRIRPKGKHYELSTPSEAWGRMTYAQIARLYGADPDSVVDAIASTIEEHLRKLRGKGKPISIEKIKEFEKISPAELQHIIRQAVKASQKHQAGALTREGIKENIRDAIKEHIKAAPREAVKPAFKPIVKAPVKTAVVEKPIERLLQKPLKLKPILRLPPPSATDKEKRAYIKAKGGGVTQNMGKLGRKNPQDIWHVWLPNKEHIVLKGKPPEGTRILADGKGSAHRTTQAIGGPLRRSITHQHGAVRANIRPSRTPKGAEVRFTPRTGLKSVRRGKQYFTPMRGGVAISRRSLGRRRRR